MTPLFEPGRVRATERALTAMCAAGDSPYLFLSRHFSGDWGHVTPEEKQLNDEGVIRSLQILSSYLTSTGAKLLLVTAADRNTTTFLLPDEYGIPDLKFRPRS